MKSNKKIQTSKNSLNEVQGLKPECMLKEHPPNSNQKKNKTIKKKGVRKSIFVTEYMKKIIMQKGSKGMYYCDLCPDKPTFAKKNINRHLLHSETHSNMILTQEHIDGHKELLSKIEEKINNNKRSKNSANTTSEKKDYLQFIAFCQSQNFSFKQISTLGKYLKEIINEKSTSFIENNTFDREEIATVSKCLANVF